MQELSIRALSREESYQASQDYFDGIPEWVSIKWLCHKLNVSDRTIVKYRKLLFANSSEYQMIAIAKGIDWSTTLDSPPLVRRQVEMIIHVASLFAAWRDEKAVLSVLRSQYPHPLDEDLDFTGKI